MQNLVAVSHTMRACRSQKFWGTLGPTLPWDRDMVDALEIRYSLTCVIPNFVALS